MQQINKILFQQYIATNIIYLLFRSTTEVTFISESTSSFDTEKAKEALEEAGWTYKYNRWQKTENYTTQTLKLTLVVDKENENRVKVAELIEEQLEDIGIKVTLNKVSNSKYKEYLENKNYDIILTGVYNGYSPDLSYFFGEDNIANYENEELSTILEEVKSITDEETLKEKYEQIVQIYEDDIPYICLYRNKGKVIYSIKMSGEFSPTNYTAYYNIDMWYRN